MLRGKPKPLAGLSVLPFDELHLDGFVAYVDTEVIEHLVSDLVLEVQPFGQLAVCVVLFVGPVSEENRVGGGPRTVVDFFEILLGDGEGGGELVDQCGFFFSQDHELDAVSTIGVDVVTAHCECPFMGSHYKPCISCEGKNYSPCKPLDKPNAVLVGTTLGSRVLWGWAVRKSSSRGRRPWKRSRALARGSSERRSRGSSRRWSPTSPC